MRLSLDVARKFFDLQDMLGFDKASKTVDWLLTNATSSIKELVSSSPPPHAAGKSESSTSECEVISTSTPLLPVAAVENITLQPAKVVPLRRSRKGATHPMLSRESRVLARARARERTREKLGGKEPKSSGRGSFWRGRDLVVVKAGSPPWIIWNSPRSWKCSKRYTVGVEALGVPV
ncbi:unnamed protein product [Spirodela intermedia]|uniref:Uncharacterized protein n=1 Tax=Spirodela intermedia TaxID=51605 RepID=A0A7I8J633_SPIIN|nr:unnamed protein product [Spirodela intermedia]CAA6664853.1 unnamed protein product [Spirodela intermedia]